MAKQETKAEETKQEAPAIDLAAIQEQMRQMMTKIGTLQQQNSMLIKIADKKQLANFLAHSQQNKETFVKLGSYTMTDKDGKPYENVIVSMKKVVDQVWKDENNRWRENQQIEISFADGTKKVDTLYNYIHTVHSAIKAKVTAKTIDEATGATMLTVEREDNAAKIVVDSDYVNL